MSVMITADTIGAAPDQMSAAPRLTLTEWATRKGLVLTEAVDAHIHAGLRSAPKTKTYKRWYFSELLRLQDLRDKTVALYREAVEKGEVIDPSANRMERLRRTAMGHSDNPSVQAARRILAGIGHGDGEGAAAMA